VIPNVAFSPLLNQKVVNQFGTFFVDIDDTSDLLVPTAKSRAAAPAPPVAPAVDHFLCHAVKLAQGVKFRLMNVAVQDQFVTRLIDVAQPTRLCAPVNKSGEDPSAPTHPGHLLCYKTQVSKFSGLKFGPPIKPIYVNNQFGADALSATGLSEFCVPSAKNP
jgi:hypothetical protein